MDETNLNPNPNLTDDDYEPVVTVIRHTGVPEWVAAVLLAISVFSVAFAFFEMREHPTDPTAQVKAAETQKAMEWQLGTMKLDQALRMDVAKRCADRGNTPEVIMGNVYCKPSPSAASASTKLEK